MKEKENILKQAIESTMKIITTIIRKNKSSHTRTVYTKLKLKYCLLPPPPPPQTFIELFNSCLKMFKNCIQRN